MEMQKIGAKRRGLVVLVSGLFLCVFALKLEAQGTISEDKDTILWNGEKGETRCTILEETFSKVVYTTRGLKEEALQNDIKEIKLEKLAIQKEAEDMMNGGDYPSAIKEFDKLIDISTKYNKVNFLQYGYYYKALCYARSGDFDNAIKSFKEVLTKFPNTKFLVDTYFNLLECYKAKNDLNNFTKTLLEFQNFARDNGMKELLLEIELINADLLEAKENTKGALEIYKKYSSDKDNYKALAGELRCRRQLDDPKLEEFANQIIQSENPNAIVMCEAWNCLGNVYLKKGENKEALLAFLRSAAYYGQSPTSGHEYALFGTIIAMARYAKDAKDNSEKSLYKERAKKLKQELSSTYHNSIYIQKAESEIANIK